ncbi:hypothetical protein RB195_004168 [Necator americanus]|uniref:Uncharacterized protein n=1 Tax=Necator americanus TaxID=51031 RepID=A0ABR1BKP0_NECAM
MGGCVRRKMRPFTGDDDEDDAQPASATPTPWPLARARASERCTCVIVDGSALRATFETETSGDIYTYHGALKSGSVALAPSLRNELLVMGVRLRKWVPGLQP